VAHAQSLLGKTEATGNEDEHEDALEEEETKEDENEQASLPGEDDAKEKKIEALTKKVAHAKALLHKKKEKNRRRRLRCLGGCLGGR